MMMRSTKGSMLLMAFYVIVSLVAISAAFVMMMVNDRLSTTRLLKIQQAHALAEAGIEKAIEELRKDYRANQNWSDGRVNGTVLTQSTTEYYGFIPAFSEGKGTFTVWLKNVQADTDHVWIKSQGIVGDAKSTIGVYLEAVNPSDWSVQTVLWQKI